MLTRPSLYRLYVSIYLQATEGGFGIGSIYILKYLVITVNNLASIAGTAPCIYEKVNHSPTLLLAVRNGSSSLRNRSRYPKDN
jgi:hypothetical protein